jgi:hypothetical protein
MNKLIIKKHKSKNSYLLTEHGLWVRDFTSPVHPVDINDLTEEKDYSAFTANELAINTFRIPEIDKESIHANDIVIVSDGYDFDKKKKLLASLPRGVIIIGVNRTLAKWDKSLRMDYFLVNNPYQECMTYFPTTNYYPKCVISSRVYPEFVKQYKFRRGVVYKYTPTREINYGGLGDTAIYYIDDYRNPICSAIGLAFRWGASRICLFCCDDVFNAQRPASIQLPNKMWMYPQHMISHKLIDANLHWLTNQKFNKVKVSNFSEGPEYKNAPYISEGEFLRFFTK